MIFTDNYNMRMSCTANYFTTTLHATCSLITSICYTLTIQHIEPRHFTQLSNTAPTCRWYHWIPALPRQPSTDPYQQSSWHSGQASPSSLSEWDSAERSAVWRMSASWSTNTAIITSSDIIQ